MTKLCLHIVDDVLPRNKGVNWDHLRVEVWASSGRVIVFPASSNTPYRVEKAACQVIFDELAQRFQEWGDSMDEDEFDHQMKAEESRWFEHLLRAARGTSLRDTRMIFWHADGDKPDADVVV